MKVNYLEILKKSLKETWKNRILWFFGFFIALGSGGSSWVSFDFSGDDLANQNEISNFASYLNQNRGILMLALACIVILMIFFLFLRIISQAAIIWFVGAKKQQVENGFTRLFKKGAESCKKLVVLDVVLVLLVSILMILFIAPPIYLFYANSIVLGVVVSIMAMIIALPIILIIAFVRRYAYLYIVLGKLSIRSSLEKSYLLLRSRFYDTVIFSILLLLVEIFLNIAILAFIVITFISLLPIIFITGFNLENFEISKNYWVVAVLGGVVLLLLMTISSILSAYKEVSWTNFFREITGQKKKEELEEAKKLARNEAVNPQAL